MSFESTCIMFSVREEFNGLEEALEALKEKNVKVSHVESRKSRDNDSVDVFVECEVAGNVDDVIARLNDHRSICNVRQRIASIVEENNIDNIPWFPRCLADLDRCGENVLMYGSELDAEHPGFKDKVYRERRAFFTDIAMNHKHGLTIPQVQYTKEEIGTWKTVYNGLMDLYPTHACAEHMRNIPLLASNCGFTEDNIPQLEDVSQFLQSRTGFRLRPVAGFLSPRDFLAGLAFRVFNCTQYIRHSSDPFYTPEPDVCHELLGHVPLLADPSFAQFSQEIGLSSLGASEADISKLAACYLYTVEFGICKEDGRLKAYGAGLLSCIAELKHALTSPEKVKPFDPEVASNQEFYVTTFQPVYFLSETLEEAKDKMRKFVKKIQRPFSVRYNSTTCTVHVTSRDDSINLDDITTCLKKNEGSSSPEHCDVTECNYDDITVAVSADDVFINTNNEPSCDVLRGDCNNNKEGI